MTDTFFCCRCQQHKRADLEFLPMRGKATKTCGTCHELMINNKGAVKERKKQLIGKKVQAMYKNPARLEEFLKLIH
jgi:hypothetical protein